MVCTVAGQLQFDGRESACTHGVSLDGKDRGTVRKNRELVVVRLLAEDLPARQRRDASLDARLLEELSRLERDRNLGTGRDNGDGGVLGLADDVATLRGLLDRRVLELVKVLAREAAGRVGSGGSCVSMRASELCRRVVKNAWQNAPEDGRSAGRSQGHVVRSRGLVSVCSRD